MLGCTLEHRGFSCKQSATSALETCLFLELSLLLLHILSKKKKKQFLRQSALIPQIR